MSDSRVLNTKRNIITGLFQQLLNIILPFIVRTMILYILGDQYQGLNGLFTSVLSILNLSELGFSYAVTYILFKPIANGDNELICAVMAYLRKVYRYVGAAVLVLGLAVMPFLRYLINGSVPDDVDIYILYAVYLGNSVVSYLLFAYKTSLITAMQRMDIINIITMAVKTVMQISQIAVLIVFRSYYWFIALIPVFTVINDLLTEYASRRAFPDIKPVGRIPDDIKKDLITQVKGIFIGRVSDAARNGADNIFISALIGLTAVAVYNNYYYIYYAVYAVSLVIANSMGASVGNSIASETKEKNYSDLCRFTFIFSWFTGWCTICMLCMYQDFMLIWMRGDTSLMLPDHDMILFCIYFYAIAMNNIRNQYVNGSGLFWELRASNVCEAVSNIVLNFVLGYFFGITGIIAATLITIVVFNFAARTNILFKKYFEMSPVKFYTQNLLYIGVTAAVGALTYFVCSFVTLEGIPGLAAKLLICILLPNIIELAIYFRTDRFKDSVRFLGRILRRKQPKQKK